METGPEINTRTVYIDYPFEEVMFRRDHVTKSIFRKFYGEVEGKDLISDHDELLNEAFRFGNEITRQEYRQGKPRD